MVKESELFVSSPLFIINEKTVFGGEGFALTKFGSDLQEIFIKRIELNELARRDGTVSGELKLSSENEIKERCSDLGISRQDKFLDVLERQFVTIVARRHDAATHSISNGRPS